MKLYNSTTTNVEFNDHLDKSITAVATKEELEGLGDGAKARLENWRITATFSSLDYLTAIDAHGKYVTINNVPEKILKLYRESHVPIMQPAYVVVHSTDFPHYSAVVYSWYVPSHGKCDCGAKFTSMPNQHSEWCNHRIIY